MLLSFYIFLKIKIIFLKIIFKDNSNDYCYLNNYLHNNLENPNSSFESSLMVQSDHFKLDENESFGLNEFSQVLKNELDILRLIAEDNLNKINQCEFDQYYQS